MALRTRSWQFLPIHSKVQGAHKDFLENFTSTEIIQEIHIQTIPDGGIYKGLVTSILDRDLHTNDSAYEMSDKFHQRNVRKLAVKSHYIIQGRIAHMTGYEFQKKSLLPEDLTAAGACVDKHGGNRGLAQAGKGFIEFLLVEAWLFVSCKAMWGIAL